MPLAEGACIAAVTAFGSERARNTEMHEQNGFSETGVEAGLAAAGDARKDKKTALQAI